MFNDFRYGIRLLLKNPGFTAVAVLTLALGIGANTAIFTVVNTVLLQPLAYPEPDCLVQLELSSPQGNGNITSIPKFIIWREQTQVFQDVAAYDLGGPGVNLTGGDRPEQLKGVHVSAEFFRLFGARVVAASGEVLEPEDVADVVVEGLRDERFLILPHPEVLEFFRRKASDYDRWLAGMRRLQAHVAGDQSTLP